MKPGIHPTYYEDALVVCACGNTWHTGSTKKEIHTDVCFKCHPFYTGEQRIVDTAGQVERFMKRVTAREQIAPEAQARPSKKERRAKARQARSGIPEAEAIAGESVQVTPETTPAAETQVAPATTSPEAAAEQVQAAQSRAERRRNRPPRPLREQKTAEPATEKPAEPPAETSAPTEGTPAE